jgi:hypothetical protein
MATPGTTAYRRLRECIDRASDPSTESASCCHAAFAEPPGPAFLVNLRARTFRSSSKTFAFLQIGLEGKILRFHPFAACAGPHELRVTEGIGLTYLTEPASGRTWVSTLGPFRTARREGREAAAVAIAAPYDSLDTARQCAPRLVAIAQWLKAHHEKRPVPLLDGQPLHVELSGQVVAGLHIIDSDTGRQMVTLRSRSLKAGAALLKPQRDALQVTQGGVVVYFPVKDLIQRWGTQLTRSAIYACPEDARRRAAELQAHRQLGQLAAQALSSGVEPGAALLAQMEQFGSTADPVCSDHRGSIGIALALPKRFGGARRVAFRLKDYGPHARFAPAVSWMPHQGLLVMWTAASGDVVAFGLGRHGVRRLGVFDSVKAARKAASAHPATLISDAFARRRARDPEGELAARIAAFNTTNLALNADSGQVPLHNVFTGATRRFRTSSARGTWTPRLLLTSAGPLLILLADSAARQSTWLAYGPLRDPPGAEVLEACAEGRGRMSLEALSVLLSKELGVRVDTVDPDAAATARLDAVQHVLRKVIPGDLFGLQRLNPDAQVRFFYDFARSLKQDLLSDDTARKREAILAAEYFYFGKPCEQLLNVHAPLLKQDPAAWSVFLGEGGRADTRVKEMIRGLALLESERPQRGLPSFMRPRFARLLDSVAHVTPDRL